MMPAAQYCQHPKTTLWNPNSGRYYFCHDAMQKEPVDSPSELQPRLRRTGERDLLFNIINPGETPGTHMRMGEISPGLPRRHQCRTKYIRGS
jgi:hypothetical protein